MRLRGLVLLLLSAAGAAQAQTPSKLQSAGVPQARIDVGSNAAQAGGAPNAPGTPLVAEPIYALRAFPRCADFRRVDGGWAALGPLQFPGPRGPIKLTQGQAVSPGGYLDGMDLGALLNRDCPNAVIDRTQAPGAP